MFLNWMVNLVTLKSKQIDAKIDAKARFLETNCKLDCEA